MSDQHDEVAAQRALRELRAEVQQSLDSDGAALDADIALRLEQARNHALRAAPAGRRYRLMAVPAVAVLLLALALPLMQNTSQQDGQTPSSNATADFDITELEPWQEDAELLDDLDFYAWLELEAEHAS